MATPKKPEGIETKTLTIGVGVLGTIVICIVSAVLFVDKGTSDRWPCSDMKLWAERLQTELRTVHPGLEVPPVDCENGH